ncbi:MAG: carboxypeptidase-like regulatory domain-containing protein [Armatimonadota bacterium]|nr:carboxypeptidase-like regulatory domain-containing protein [Armatimonadota bacterium]
MQVMMSEPTIFPILLVRKSRTHGAVATVHVWHSFICAAILLLLLTCTGSMCASIRCSVYERHSNRGIEGASVVAISQGDTQVFLGPETTDARGDCLFQNIPVGQWQFVVVHLGYAPARALVSLEDEDDELSISIPIEPMPMLYGKVMNERGKPIANASVKLQLRSEAIEMQCTVQTDSDGNYRIWLGTPMRIVIGEQTLTNMPSQHVDSFSMSAHGEALTGRTIQIEAHARGYRTTIIDVQIPKGQMKANADIRLTALGSNITGTLVNQRSEPIAKARVELRSLSTGESLISHTDEFGSFQFDSVLAGRYLLTLTGIERLTFQPRLIEVKEGETLTLHLIAILQELSPSVTFFILGEDGKTPVGNTKVQIIMRMLFPERAYGSSAVLVTDAQGKCTMPVEKEPAIYRAFLNFSGWSFIATVDTQKTRMPEVKLTLPKQPQVLCRVKAHSNEMFNAYVHLRMQGEPFWENIGTTEEGVLKVAGLLPGDYELAATPTNIYAYSDSLHASVFPPLRIQIKDGKENEPIEVTLPIPKCVKLAGKTVMKRGAHEEALKNATVQLEQISSAGSRFSLIAVSRQDGTFEFSAVPLGSYKLKASHITCDDFETNLKIDENTFRKGSAEILLKLNYIGLGAISGRLVDCNGQPVKGAKVSIRMWHNRLRHEYEVATTKTSNDGTFSIVNLRSGQYSVEFTTEDEGGTLLRNIRVEGDKTSDLGTIKLPQPAMLVGRVVAYDQSIVEDLQLFVCVPGATEQLEAYLQHSISPPESVAKRVINLDYDGKFSINLPEGEYELVLYGKPILSPVSRKIRLNSGEKASIELKVQKPALIEGQVRRIDTGEAVMMAILTLYSISGRKVAQTVTDAGGFYRLANVPPGIYSVRCRGEGLAAAVRHHVRLESGDNAIIDFNLSPGASVSGKIAAKGKIRGDFRFYQVIPNADVSLASSVTPEGEFRIEHLPPGRHIIMVYYSGELVAAKEVILREGEEKKIQITF